MEKDDPAFQTGEDLEVKSVETPTTSSEEPKPKKPSNLVTSWGPGVTKLTANSKATKPAPSKAQLPPKSLTVPQSGRFCSSLNWTSCLISQVRPSLLDP